jgi:hypothetical protein
MAELNQEEIILRLDQLTREYGETPPGDPRRTEIANELSELCLYSNGCVAIPKVKTVHTNTPAGPKGHWAGGSKGSGPSC